MISLETIIFMILGIYSLSVFLVLLAYFQKRISLILPVKISLFFSFLYLLAFGVVSALFTIHVFSGNSNYNTVMGILTGIYVIANILMLKTNPRSPRPASAASSRKFPPPPAADILDLPPPPDDWEPPPVPDPQIAGPGKKPRRVRKKKPEEQQWPPEEEYQ